MKKYLVILMMSTAVLVSGCTCNHNKDGKPCKGKPCADKMKMDSSSHFAFDSYALTSADKQKLDSVAKRLAANDKETIVVKGYTDSVGTDAYNQGLSERRAGAVAGYLKSKGVAAKRITTKGYGKTNFIASNDTAEGRAKNRRTEIEFK